MNETILRVQDLSVTLGGKSIIENLNFDVAPGETLALLGGSGTGKSVTLKTILGLLPAQSGTIELGGVDVFAARGRDAAQARNHRTLQTAARASHTTWQPRPAVCEADAPRPDMTGDE